MSSNLDFVRLEPSSGEVLQGALASVWRRKRLVLALLAIALTFGILAIAVLPPRYTAEAYIRGELAAPDPLSKEDETVTGGSINLDLVRLIETQSRLLQSHQVARRVVEELGLERLQPVISKGGWLPAFGAGASLSGDETDTAATRLLGRLSVISDPRSYLITVRYTAADPELANSVANAFVAELLRSTKLQALSERRSVAQATLLTKLTKFGEKHPGVAQARARVAATEERMKAQLSEPHEAILQAAGEDVTKAKATRSSPTPPFLISLFLLVGLVAGTGVALWLERNRWGVVFSQYYTGPPA